VQEDGELVVHASVRTSLAGLTSPSYNITATLSNFAISLIGEPSFITVYFKSLVFTSSNGSKPDCKATIASVDFGAALAYIQELAALLAPNEQPFIDFADGLLTAGFRFDVPAITVGVFNLMQLAQEVSMSLPFNGDPVRVFFGISDKQNPFLLSAGIYGGGGFIQMRLGLDGVQELSGAFDFGVVAIIGIGPLHGWGEVVAGISFEIGGVTSIVCGFVHAHGHVDVFGIISMDVDVLVQVCYDNGSVTGTAEFTVDIEILFFSVTYHLQANYTFAGKGSSHTFQPQSSVAELSAAENHAKAGAMPTQGISPQPATSGPVLDDASWNSYFEHFITFPKETDAA